MTELTRQDGNTETNPPQVGTSAMQHFSRNQPQHAPLSVRAETVVARRPFLGQSVTSLQSIALLHLLQSEAEVLAAPRQTLDNADKPAARGSSQRPHFAAPAKRVLVIFCAGACSQLETWDYKPELIRRDGQPMPGGPAVTFQGPAGNLARPQYRFRPRGESGKMVSDLLPHLGGLVDDFAFLHSLTSRTNTHGPAENYISTGFVEDGFPSMGAWLSYALGTENHDLPAFVAIPDPRGIPQASVNNWGPGFLPAVFQGTAFNSQQPIRHLTAPPNVSVSSDQATRDLLRLMNNQRQQQRPADAELAARIASYELAGRMQTSVPEVTDLSAEPEHILRMYGADDAENETRASFAKNCILARRLLENGVRFVQLFNGAYASGGKLNWDGHQELRDQYDVHGRILDQPAAALIQDLRQRGLLEDTLVVWCTEFGRMPMFQKGARGRDHNPNGFTAFLTGAGVRSGVSYGLTDELGFGVADKPLMIHDLNATILHLLGIDHKQLTWKHNGISRRLTDVHGHVIPEILS